MLSIKIIKKENTLKYQDTLPSQYELPDRFSIFYKIIFRLEYLHTQILFLHPQ